MLNLVLAESALETVPSVLWKETSVVRRCMRLRKKPRLTMLDRSYHHRAMRRLDGAEKRGRPDIVHFSLLEALGTPLNREGLLKTYVHTVNDKLIYVNPIIRLPRNYARFIGLVEQLYERRRVPQLGPALMELKDGSLRDLLNAIKPSYIIAFSRRGKPKILMEAINALIAYDNVVTLIGAFPKGCLSRKTIELVNETISIDPEMLDAWTVTSRVIYEYERATKLTTKRLREKNNTVLGDILGPKR
jgi:rRNA small subunit pseudouridine methyltransferase Nep1